jgi:hypothetical protein
MDIDDVFMIRDLEDPTQVQIVLKFCVCVPRKNVSFKAHRLLAHNANVLLCERKEPR